MALTPIKVRGSGSRSCKKNKPTSSMDTSSSSTLSGRVTKQQRYPPSSQRTPLSSRTHLPQETKAECRSPIRLPVEANSESTAAPSASEDTCVAGSKIQRIVENRRRLPSLGEQLLPLELWEMIFCYSLNPNLLLVNRGLFQSLMTTPILARFVRYVFTPIWDEMAGLIEPPSRYTPRPQGFSAGELPTNFIPPYLRSAMTDIVNKRLFTLDVLVRAEQQYLSLRKGKSHRWFHNHFPWDAQPLQRLLTDQHAVHDYLNLFLRRLCTVVRCANSLHFRRSVDLNIGAMTPTGIHLSPRVDKVGIGKTPAIAQTTPTFGGQNIPRSHKSHTLSDALNEAVSQLTESNADPRVITAAVTTTDDSTATITTTSTSTGTPSGIDTLNTNTHANTNTNTHHDINKSSPLTDGSSDQIKYPHNTKDGKHYLLKLLWSIEIVFRRPFELQEDCMKLLGLSAQENTLHSAVLNLLLMLMTKCEHHTNYNWSLHPNTVSYATALLYRRDVGGGLAAFIPSKFHEGFQDQSNTRHTIRHGEVQMWVRRLIDDEELAFAEPFYQVLQEEYHNPPALLKFLWPARKSTQEDSENGKEARHGEPRQRKFLGFLDNEYQQYVPDWNLCSDDNSQRKRYQLVAWNDEIRSMERTMEHRYAISSIYTVYDFPGIGPPTVQEVRELGWSYRREAYPLYLHAMQNIEPSRNVQ